MDFLARLAALVPRPRRNLTCTGFGGTITRMAPSRTRPARTVVATLGFSADMDMRPKFHANDTTRDVLRIEQRPVTIDDARSGANAPSLDVEGFQLRRHESAVRDFRDADQVARVNAAEIRDLLLDITGAGHVAVTAPGILRFSERSAECGSLDNSRPARFVHIDCSDAAASDFYARSRPADARPIGRSAQYNVWRVLTPPPQDVPLAVCDARSLSPEDLIPADALFDQGGQIRWSFESLLIRHNPKQRWAYYPDMDPGEVLVFKTHDTDPSRAHHVAHGAFTDPACPPGAAPRASIEMRGIAYWFD